MIWHFPTFDALHLALTSGVVPPSVAVQPVSAAFDDGQVWVEWSATRPAQAQLRKLGVQIVKASAVPLARFSCWPELFPLRRVGDRIEQLEKVPVLFDLPAARLAELVTEVLRLGNDRQQFRHLEEDRGPGRALLRVIGPPYYSLLRAIDPPPNGIPVVAYVEALPRVWVQAGWTHPLGTQLRSQIKVAEGKLLLIRPSREWTVVDEAPFQDIYSVLEFPLPAASSKWRDTDLGKHIQVSLRLVPGGTAEGAELWVVRERPVEQLDELVRNADDRLLGRLAFAVAEQHGQTLIVLRVRPSKQAPPVVVVQATGFHAHLKMPNLFVPSGTRLHPPLRRDVVRKLLAEDPAVITWLYPGENGTFTPECLPDTAFRPLSDWIDYVLDHDRVALQEWVQSTQFDFEPFVCSEEQAAKPKRPPGSERERPTRGRAPKGDDTPVPATPFAAVRKSVPEVDDLAEMVLAKIEPSQLEKELGELEERFLAVEGGLDQPERQALWPELAKRNGALKRGDEAGLCWMSHFWASEHTSPAHAWQWFAAEAAHVGERAYPGSARARSWTAPALRSTGEREVASEDLDRVLTIDEPSSADVRALAAYVHFAALNKHPSTALVERLGRVRHFLEKHELLLPVRAVWLAWTSLVHLSHGDVLGLARTRDRLLERLYQSGLRPEQDLPGFLRFLGTPTSERHRAFRHWLAALCESARAWNRRVTRDLNRANLEFTLAYIDLFFAFGLARIGETDKARALMQRAGKVLEEGDDVHLCLHRNFCYRINQALGGKAHAGPLPQEELEAISIWKEDPTGRLSLYLVDRMREQSRILEPDLKVEAYRHWTAPRMGDLEKALGRLQDVHDRAEIVRAIDKLLGGTKKDQRGLESRARILRTALALAPRLGEDNAVRLLALIGPTFDALGVPSDTAVLIERAEMLERGLFTAAHFDRLEHVQALVARFQKLLQSQAANTGNVQALNAVAAQSFRGLRKLGLRDEIDQLLRDLATVILASQNATSVQALLQRGVNEATRKYDTWVAALQSLLQVAAGWYWFGRDSQAEPVLNAVRTVLFRGVLLDPKSSSTSALQQTMLACTYLEALGQAPPEFAQKRIEELFGKLEVRDSFTTNSHYSRCMLLVVEAAVRAVVSDDVTMGSDVRRWLDEDEFLVRRRIHRDLRALMSTHGE